ncbi:MAG TPA: T9SS type A sorting domain-containing protein [Chitinophagaceae bacterium]|nr:T9SS type A sorting domain-containing protein [Chitinophagaceae bacterium]
MLSLAAIALVITAYFKFSNKTSSGPKQEEVLTAYEMMGLWGQMRAYPHPSIPEEKFHQAFQKLQAHEARARAMRSAPNSTLAPAVPWTPLAPKNFGGRILCLAFHPTNQNVMWVGSASGGLWKTTNGGTGAANGINWTNVPTGFPVLGISSIAVNNSNPNELYLGTGEVYNSGGAGYQGHNDRTFRGSYGIGILKTTDGGVTWTKSLDFSYSSLKGVADLLINPLRPSTVYAATTDGVYRSNNSGETWRLIHTIPMAMDICMKPNDTSTLFVGCGNFGSAGTGIYRSTNAGAATPTFSRLTSGLPSTITGMIRLHISPNNSSKVYASIGKSPGSSASSGLYSSTNSGSSWTRASSTAYISNQGWYSHDVVASPSNANTIYVAEMDMYRSTSGGGTLTKLSSWNLWDFNNTTVGTLNEGTTTKYVHADIHRLYMSPFSNSTVFACTDGGLFKTTNSGYSFVGLNGGLQTAQIYATMAVSNINPNFMICGLQDNATFVYDGAPGCRRKIGGDGFSAVIDPTNDNNCFGSLYYFTIYKSTNRGSSFSTVYSNSSGSEKACFSAPLVMSRNNPNVMYGGTIYVKKSTNKGSTWTNANGGLPLSNSSAPILKIAVSHYSTDKLYASTVPGGGARSRLFRSTNGGGNWNEITSTLPDRYYTDIAVDPNNDDRIIVTLSGFGSGHVFFSNNQGNTWTDISANLPDIPHNTAIFDPADPQTIIVGNDLGVYYTTGFSDPSVLPQWMPYNDGLTDATMVMDLAVASNNKLRMGTHGKGLWETDMPGTLAPSFVKMDKTPNAVNQGATTVDAYPNPTFGGFTIAVDHVAKAGRASLKIVDISGSVVQQSVVNLQPGRNVLQGDLSRQRKGTYYLVVETANGRISRRVVKQ